MSLLRCLYLPPSSVLNYSHMPYDPDFHEQLAEAQDLFVWETPAYERHDRGKKWYIIMGLVALGLVTYAVIVGNILFAFIILIAAIIITLAGNERPHKVLVQVGENGVVVNGDFLLFDDIDHFAIVYQPPHIRVLYLYPKSVFRHRVRIQLGGQDPVQIRNHLTQYVEEDLDLRDEHASDILAKLFKL